MRFNPAEPFDWDAFDGRRQTSFTPRRLCRREYMPPGFFFGASLI
jgi:hypothetical protein